MPRYMTLRARRLVRRHGSIGTFTYQVSIRDSTTQQVSATCSAPVQYPDPYVTGFNYSPSPAKAAQVVNVNIYGGSFYSGVTQVWLVGPNCASPGCQTTALSFSGNAYIGAQALLNTVGTYSVNIRNASGTWVQA